MGNVYLGDKKVTSKGWYLGDAPLFDDGDKPIFIGDDGKEYYEEDCHIFIANSRAVNLPIPNGTTPTFVAVDGEQKDYNTEVKGKVFNGSKIHAIFDWDNSDFDPENPDERNMQNWFSDILLFGLNSDGKRNQLKNGVYAFAGMTASPKILADLDISNLTTLEGMFAFSKFDVDISGWDTADITNMDEMFFMSTEFNHDLGNWKVEKVELIVRPNLSAELGEDVTLEKPVGFDAGAFNWRSSRPPFTLREENKKWFEGFPVTIDGVTYTEEDAHMMVSTEIAGPFPSNNAMFHRLPITDAKLVVHNGVIKEYTDEGGVPVDIGFSVFNTWIVIGDWGKETFNRGTHCNFLKIGSRSVGDEPEGYVNPPALPSGRIPNQLKSGENAFKYLQFDLVIETTLNNLDTSNLTNMDSMFESAYYFNEDISGWDTSNVKSMSSMLSSIASVTDEAYSPEFNQDISKWDVSNVVDMSSMFRHQRKFNQNISGWNTSKVTSMGGMFYNAASFNQDLSEWCVSNVPIEPSDFDKDTDNWEGGDATRPDWGNCPRHENIFPITGNDGKEYEYKDAHIFVANGNAVKFPVVEWGPPLIFVAVDGVEKNYESEVKGNSFNDSTIHAIFDWNNYDVYEFVDQDWFSDILQFGSRSVGDEPPGYVNPPALASGRIPNQLQRGGRAFQEMIANPNAVANLDVSNLTDMGYMFQDNRAFNQDISNWDTSNVTNMDSMFMSTDNFNQDISGWDTSKVKYMGDMFAATKVFNSDISQWDTSNVTNMGGMFSSAYEFNQNISGWDTSNVTSMKWMFSWAHSFNQDLSEWCVSNIAEKPDPFDDNADKWEGGDATRPQWGTCPRGEDGS